MTRTLFRLARLSATVGALTSGSAMKIIRRAKNILLGRVLARLGFWRRLWH